MAAALRRRGPALLGRFAGLRRYIPHRLWATFSRRYPRISELLRRRVELRRTDGLLLSLIVIGAIYAASLFAGLVDEVYEAEELKAFDEAVFAAIESYRSAALVAVFRFITALGSTETLVAVTLVATGFLLAHGPRRYVGPLWVVIVGSQLTTWMGKFLVDRGRPDFILDVTAASPSFPSAHAAGATAIYGVIAYALARDLPGSWRLHVGYWTVVLAALIGASRVFLNVHFASDVAAGHLAGIFWLLAGIAMAEHRRAGESG